MVAGVALAAGLLMVSAGASAQSAPLREAPIIEPQLAPWPPAAPAAAPATSPPTAELVVQIYLDACVQHEGQSGAAIDWALARGFEPLDPLRTGAEDLLSGAAGAVLAAPGTAGRVLLAAGEDRRCIVWAEQTNGPRLRTAFQRMVGELGAKGARVQPVIDRNLNSAGSWRNQLQWRYRRVGGSEDFGLGSATTLAAGTGTQLLHFAPMARVAPPYPDGMPSR
ncbi:MAG: hypothetical protein AD742_02555 [Methylibium sp. NZG]|nr:MAG: hypothetical protein AD742_02555 [Methylibium sp. NZG]